MSRKWIKRGMWSAASGLVLVLGLFLGARFLLSTGFSESWKQLTPALKRDDLVAMQLGRHFGDMLELKGYDFFYDRTNWLGGSWRLQVTYDAAGQVKTVDASYLHPQNGWLHRHVPLIP